MFSDATQLSRTSELSSATPMTNSVVGVNGSLSSVMSDGEAIWPFTVTLKLDAAMMCTYRL